VEECPVFDMAAEDEDEHEVVAEVSECSVTSSRKKALQSFLQGLARPARLVCGAGIAFLLCLMCLHILGLGPENHRRVSAAVMFSRARVFMTALEANANIENIKLGSSWYMKMALQVVQSTAVDTIPNAARSASFQVQLLIAAVGAYTPECAYLQKALTLLKPMATVVANKALKVYADRSSEIAAVFVGIVVALALLKTARCRRSRLCRDVAASGVTAPMKGNCAPANTVALLGQELSCNCAPANTVEQDFADMVGKSPVGAAVVMGLSVSQRMISAATKQDETGVLDFASQSLFI